MYGNRQLRNKNQKQTDKEILLVDHEIQTERHDQLNTGKENRQVPLIDRAVHGCDDYVLHAPTTSGMVLANVPPTRAP